MERGFESVKDLLEALRDESHEYTRFPARFILLNGLSVWTEMIAALKLEADRTLALSCFCKDQDLFPSLSFAGITDCIKKPDSSRVLLLPISECLRFSEADMHSNYSSFLREIAQWEFPGRKRIYIPLFEYTAPFFKEMDKIPRFHAGELPEVWTLRGEGGTEINVIPFEAKRIQCKTIKGFKTFLEMWENGGAPRVQLVSRIAPYIGKQTGNYDVESFGDGFVFVEEQLSGLTNLQREWGQEERWTWLAKELEPGESFGGLASRLLNLKDFHEIQLLSRWGSLDDSKQWLAWLWCKVESRRAGNYFRCAIQNSQKHNDLIDSIINSIFYTSLDFESLEERKLLLENVGVTNLPSSFWLSINKLERPLDRLKCLTGFTQQEKEVAVSCLRDIIQQEIDPSIWLGWLKISYPELYFYLSGYSWKEEFIEEYFDFYLSSRVLDFLREEMPGLAQEIAKTGKIWGIPTRQSILERKGKDRVRFLWVDGMGLEWAGLLANLIGAQKWIKVEVIVARANFPTITAFNKGWETEEEVMRGLDQMAHLYSYSYPRSLVQEMDLIGKVSHHAVNLLRDNDEVVITADHGLSRSLFHKNRMIVAPEGATVHQWGRFATLGSDLSRDEPDSLWISDGDKLILAVHGRFEGGSGSIGEIHGGATPEECLVPVVRLVKSKLGPKGMAREGFKLVSSVVNLDVKGRGYLQLQLSGPATGLHLIVGARSFPGVLQKESNLWIMEIEGLRPGVYKGRIEYEGGLLGEISFEIIKGIREDDMGL